jgi:hypothetical protein
MASDGDWPGWRRSIRHLNWLSRSQFGCVSRRQELRDRGVGLAIVGASLPLGTNSFVRGSTSANDAMVNSMFNQPAVWQTSASGGPRSAPGQRDAAETCLPRNKYDFEIAHHKATVTDELPPASLVRNGNQKYLS